MPDYPDTVINNCLDQLHGEYVPDPYRWLELIGSSAVSNWLDQQNSICEEVLRSFPIRETLRREMENLLRREKYRIPTRVGDKYFFLYNDGSMENDALFCSDLRFKKMRKCFDPNIMADDIPIAIKNYSVSPNGSIIALAITRAGSSLQQIYLLNTTTGDQFGEKLERCQFTHIAWNIDESGFFYSGYSKSNAAVGKSQPILDHALYFHRVGTDQTTDTRIFKPIGNREMLVRGQVTEDYKYLFITGHASSDSNAVFLMAADKLDSFHETYSDGLAEFSYIGNTGSRMIVLTNYNAPNYQLITIDPKSTDKASKSTLIPETDDVLCWAVRAGDKLLVRHLHVSKTNLSVYALDGEKLSSITLPDIGSVMYATGTPTNKTAVFQFSNYTTPSKFYSLNMCNGGISEIASYHNTAFHDEFITKQIHYKSHDKTSVPMFLSYKKGLQKNGKNPVLLRVYGGFGIASTPQFNESYYQWIRMGGVLAIPGVRGGGEYGKDWHDAGKQMNKQNCIMDYIASAEWLINEKYTNAKAIVGSGGSHGGFLVAASLVKRPDLFAACILESGVYDMLRFYKYSYGWIKTAEYGMPDNPEHFKILYDISPYHNIDQNKSYPAVFVITGENDPNVYPAHSYKLVAALQSVLDDESLPVILRVNRNSGHTNRVSLSTKIDMWTDELTFAAFFSGITGNISN